MAEKTEPYSDPSADYDPFSAEKFANPVALAMPKVAYGMAKGVAQIPQRAIEASQQYQIGNPDTMNPAPFMDAAMLVTGGAGAVPAEANALRTGVGLMSKGEHLKSYPQFERLEAKGNSPDMNYGMTGWYRGGDQQPRFWVSDEGAKLKDTVFKDQIPDNKGGALASVPEGLIWDSPIPGKGNWGGKPGEWREPTLGDVWEHPKLYEAYPWLQDIPVRKLARSDASGYYSPSEGAIYVNPADPKKFHDTLHHEAVHTIQHYEGFANGGDTRQFYPEGWDKQKREFKEVESTLHNRVQLTTGLDPWQARVIANKPVGQLNYQELEKWSKLKEGGLIEPLQRLKQASQKVSEIDGEAYKRYLHLHGESEARDAPYIRNNPDKAKPGKVPLHVNPNMETGRDIQITGPFDNTSLRTKVRSDEKWKKPAALSAAGAVGAGMIPSISKAGESQGSPNPVLGGREPGKSFNTELDPLQEFAFRQWVQDNKVPFDPDARGPQDYDMRGFWQGMQQGNPKAMSAVDPNDSRLHYTDYWKTPSHETFSADSQWAPANAPKWTEDDKLVTGGGKVVYDDKAEEGNKNKSEPSNGVPKLSPGVAKFLMEFLKSNPDLAKEMSTRMQAVINGKQIQGQQGMGQKPAMPPGGPQMPPQQPMQQPQSGMPKPPMPTPQGP